MVTPQLRVFEAILRTTIVRSINSCRIQTFDKDLSTPTMATPQARALKSTSGTSPPTRRAYNGSCHCGATKYIVYLTLPTDSIHPKSPPPGTTPIYKCNCTLCAKMGLFHTRPINPPQDFLLLSPLNPMSGGLQDYHARSNWFF